MLEKAKQYGREAYHAKITTPCLDKRLMDIIAELKLPVGGGSIDIMKAWESGSREETDKATAFIFEDRR